MTRIFVIIQINLQRVLTCDLKFKLISAVRCFTCYTLHKLYHVHVFHRMKIHDITMVTNAYVDAVSAAVAKSLGESNDKIRVNDCLLILVTTI